MYITVELVFRLDFLRWDVTLDPLIYKVNLRPIICSDQNGTRSDVGAYCDISKRIKCLIVRRRAEHALVCIVIRDVLCLAKTPSGCKMDLVLKPGIVLKGIFD